MERSCLPSGKGLRIPCLYLIVKKESNQVCVEVGGHSQAKQESPEKPDNIIDKMIIGRLNKELKEICLLEQPYVQDTDLTVKKYVEKVAKENNANVTVKRFVRFETGEGLEKKNEDFAAEVAAQLS